MVGVRSAIVDGQLASVGSPSVNIVGNGKRVPLDLGLVRVQRTVSARLLRSLHCRHQTRDRVPTPHPMLSRQSRLVGPQFSPSCPTPRERRCGHGRVCLVCVRTGTRCVPVQLRHRARRRELERGVRRGCAARTGARH